jgi:hypothetical protein
VKSRDRVRVQKTVHLCVWLLNLSTQRCRTTGTWCRDLGKSNCLSTLLRSAICIKRIEIDFNGSDECKLHDPMVVVRFNLNWYPIRAPNATAVISGLFLLHLMGSQHLILQIVCISSIYPEGRLSLFLSVSRIPHGPQLLEQQPASYAR